MNREESGGGILYVYNERTTIKNCRRKVQENK